MYSSAVEHRIADPAVTGSIPAAPWNVSFAFFALREANGICARTEALTEVASPCGPIGQGV